MATFVELRNEAIDDSIAGVGKTIRLLRDHILVKPNVRTVSELIHVINHEKFNEGVIVAIGKEVYEVKPGDHIKYGNGSYLDWPIHTFGDSVYQIIREADIACVVE